MSNLHILTRKTLDVVHRENMPCARVLVALSGGADSMALLHFLMEQREALGISHMAAAHINHGLRGEEAARDEAFVRAECEKRGVPLLVHSADVAAQAAARGEGLEQAGRRVRYEFFAAHADRLKSSVATAHTRSDNAETLLLHMTRGCGLNGLAGIAPVRTLTTGGVETVVIRPLLDCTRAEVEDYCMAKGIPYVQDSTNREAVFARNRIRLRVMPELREINKQAEDALARLANHARTDDEFLCCMAEKALADTAMGDEYGGWSVEKLAALPSPLRTRALRAVVETVHPKAARHLTAAQMEKMDKLLKTGGTLTLTQGIQAYAAGGRLLVIEDMPLSEREYHEEIPLNDGISCAFYGRIYKLTLLSLDEYEKRRKVHKNLLKNSFNCDKIVGKLYLRSRRPGDIYRPAGRGMSKTLKKLLNEEGVPAFFRDAIPVLWDDEGIVMVGGFGCDERLRVDAECRRVAVFQAEEG